MNTKQEHNDDEFKSQPSTAIVIELCFAWLQVAAIRKTVQKSWPTSMRLRIQQTTRKRVWLARRVQYPLQPAMLSYLPQASEAGELQSGRLHLQR